MDKEGILVGSLTTMQRKGLPSESSAGVAPETGQPASGQNGYPLYSGSGRFGKDSSPTGADAEERDVDLAGVALTDAFHPADILTLGIELTALVAVDAGLAIATGGVASSVLVDRSRPVAGLGTAHGKRRIRPQHRLRSRAVVRVRRTDPLARSKDSDPTATCVKEPDLARYHSSSAMANRSDRRRR